MNSKTKKKRKSVTLEDIAERLNISKNAVSLALANKPGVSDETRKMVFKIATELGYRVKEKQEQKGTIGLIMTKNVIEDPYFFSAIVYSVENEIRKEGYEFALYCITSENEYIVEEILHKSFLSGIIIVSAIDEEIIRKIENKKIPAVIVDNLIESSCVDLVNTDNYRSAKSAISYLLKHGFKNIGFIGDITHAISYNERWEGFLAAHKDLKVEVDKRFCKIEGFKEFDKNPEPEINEFLKKLEKLPEAFFCVSDLSTLITANILKEMGMQIPKDISIIGFDDTELVKHFKPSLSMIHIDRDYYGRRAVRQLIERIKSPDKPAEDIRIFCKLNIRRSIKVN